MGFAVAVVGGTSWIAPFVLPFVGFGGKGIVGGSFAANIMAMYNSNVPAWFSYLQSVGMAGFSKATLLKLVYAAPAAEKDLLLDYMGCYTPCECG